MLLTKCRDLIEFVAGLFCTAGCGSTAAEGESAVLTDTALAEEKSTGTVTAWPGIRIMSMGSVSAS